MSEELLKEVLDGVCLPLSAEELEKQVGNPLMNLSSGEAQRVRLARGLLQDAELFIFDEPLNGIDSTTKEKILTFLEGFLCDKTVIFVTHDESELRWVQRIYRMEAGILSESHAV